ncbi:MAG: hypothetical protein PARBA_03257 [Parabacteroides sp.]
MISKRILLLYPFLIGLGTYDPVFGNDAVFGLVELSLILVFFIFVVNIKKNIQYINVVLILPFLLVPLLLLSSFFELKYLGFEMINLRLFFSIFSFVIVIVIAKQLKVKNKDIFKAFIAGILLVSVFGMLGVISYDVGVNSRWLLGGENSNYTSSRCTFAIILSIYVMNTYVNKIKKFIMLVIILFLFFIIINSGSRGSMLISLFIPFIYIISKYKFNKIIFLFFILFLVSYYVFADIFLESVTYQRLLESAEDNSLGARQSIWQDAIQIFYSNPILGVGEIGYKQEMLYRYKYYLDTHNMYLYVLVCGGLLSIYILVLFHFYLLKIALNAIRNNKNVLPICILLFVILLAAKTGGALYSKNIWFYFSISYLSAVNENNNIVSFLGIKKV